MNVPVTQPVPPKPPVKYLWVVAAVAALGAGLSIWLGIQEKIEAPPIVGKPVKEARTALPAVKLADRKLAKTITTEEQRLTDAERKNVAREEQERQVTTLIEKARKALAAVRLTQPKENSAVTYAQQALQLAPEHAGARRLIADVMEVIISHGREALHKGDLVQAKMYQDEAAALADKYHLPNAQIVGLTHEIALEEQRQAGLARETVEKERLADEPPQQTGQSDMAAQIKKLEERQQELARREEELRKQKDAARSSAERQKTGQSDMAAQMKKVEERQKELARREEELRKQKDAARSSRARQQTGQSDMAAQIKKIEERQKELAWREEELRKQKEAARSSPPPKQEKSEVFIPPSF